jgi:6-phosphofructokinase 1
VLAGRNGIIGALTEDLIDTSKDSAAAIAALIHTPAGAFGSCRYKLKGLDENRAQYERLIDVFARTTSGTSSTTAATIPPTPVSRCRSSPSVSGYPLVAVHVPKTVDNDLAVTDNCPGFGSVAKYVATSMREAAFDVASMAKTSTKVFVLEVMGRNAGWITAAVGMAEDAATPIPLVLLFPEIPFDEANFTAAVEANVKQFGYCCVGVSEGLRSADGKLMAEAGTKDAFGHAQLGGVGPMIAGIVRDRLAYKFHWAVADYLQRAARHIASKTDLEHSYAVGKAAVKLAISGRNAVMPAIIRKSDSPYRWKIEAVPLDKVANVEKKLPPRLHQRGRLRHHREGARLSRAAHSRRNLSAVQGRRAALRAAQERRRAEEARDRVHDLRCQVGSTWTVETGTIACFEAATRSRRSPLSTTVGNYGAQPERMRPG